MQDIKNQDYLETLLSDFPLSAIGEEEKVAIRAKLLSTLCEPVQPIALQAAVLCGKVARFDVPREWPQLLPALLTAVQQSDPAAGDLPQHRALLVLHHVIKALSSKRLAADRRVFHDMTEELLPYVLHIWEAHHSALMQGAARGAEGQAAVALEKATLAVKVIRKAIVHGIRRPHENQNAMVFLGNLHEQTRVCLRLSKIFHLIDVRRP